MATYTPGTRGATPFKPMDWDSIAIPVNSIPNGSITAGTINYNYDLPGELLDYTMKYDLHWIEASGLTEQELHSQLKRELAVKLATKMMEDHPSTTQQQQQRKSIGSQK
jgi:hypothetical protein